MRDHEQIDRRSLELARAVVTAIEADPVREGLVRARSTCERWWRSDPSSAVTEWRQLLSGDWPEIRAALLDPSETGRRRRQNSPFAGVLPPQERWRIYREFADGSPAV